jgi:hypothetical protein
LKRTLVQRFVRVADNLRQLNTQFGARPYRTFLVWTKWSGGARGQGDEQVLLELELLPTPKVMSMDGVAFSIFHAGTLPVGSVKLTEVSMAYTNDQLTGHLVPGLGHVDQIPSPYDFFYEVREDGRGDNPPQRLKFRLLNFPTMDAENVQWTLMLERVSEDRGRDGQSKYLTGKE